MPVEIDEDRLKELCEGAQAEFPELDPYFIYVFAVDHLMREQGIEPDKDVVEEMIEKRKQSEFSVEIVPGDIEYENGGYAPAGQMPTVIYDSDTDDDTDDDTNDND